jgi:DNA gyrase subunit A
MQVFDLSHVQAEYILELRLRRLTRFSKLELEREQAELLAEIASLEALLADDHLLRTTVSEEMAQVAAAYGTPRRTILLESAGGTATAAAAPARSGSAAAPLEIADTPCRVLLSATGLLARTASDEPVVRDGARHRHDALLAAVATTARADVGAVTSRGRVLRLSVLDLPGLPPTDGAPSLSGGVPVGEVLQLDRGERVVALASLDPAAPPLALGTVQGTVKRVAPGDVPGNRDAWEVVTLKDGDEVVGAAAAADDDELVLVASDASLLHFPASAVRPQGRPAGGMAGMKLDPGASVVAFHVVPAGTADALVVTVAGSSSALPGTQAGTAKVTPLAAYPGKGRATGGVRAHRFLKGEDALILAWVGPSPARGVGSGGQAIALPDVDQRRDMSGTPLPAPVHAVG